MTNTIPWGFELSPPPPTQHIQVTKQIMGFNSSELRWWNQYPSNGNVKVTFRCLDHLALGVVALRAFQSTAVAFNHLIVYGINLVLNPISMGGKRL